jgi:hypothetical protein
MAGSFHIPNLPPDQKLNYIEDQKRKLAEYIQLLDDAAEKQRNEDLRPPSSGATLFPELRRHSTGSLAGSAPVAEDGFEAVRREDVPSGTASGVNAAEKAAQRGWFGGWVGGGA